MRLRKAEENKREKQDNQLAKQVNIQIQNNFNIAQKGKNNAPATIKSKESSARAAVEPEVVDKVHPTLNHKSRQIRLPQRFRD